MEGPVREFLDRLNQKPPTLHMDEAETRQGLVLSIFHLLGWNIFNTDEVRPDYGEADARVDFALSLYGKTRIFVEVKRVRERLETYQQALLEHALRERIDLAVLTNGIVWWLYLPLESGSWEQRKFYSIDVLGQDTQKAARIFYDLLGRTRVESGQSQEYAKQIYVGKRKQSTLESAMPEAWQGLFEGPDESLIELVVEATERLCGFKPDKEHVAHFLSSKQNAQLLSPSTKQPSAEQRPESQQTSYRKKRISSARTGFTGMTIESFGFRGTVFPAKSWKDMLVTLAARVAEIQGDEFHRVLQLRGHKRFYFSKRADELFSPCQVPGTDIYVETNINANRAVSISRDMLQLFGYVERDLSIGTK